MVCLLVGVVWFGKYWYVFEVWDFVCLLFGEFGEVDVFFVVCVLVKCYWVCDV